jgi:hypothetical protein
MRTQANNVAFPPSFGGCRVSQCTAPMHAIALFRTNAMFIAKPKGKGQTLGPLTPLAPCECAIDAKGGRFFALCVSACHLDLLS